jgi:hypothetical protein
MLAGLAFLAGTQLAAAESIYGHITFVDNGASILRVDGGEIQALVNMPLAPGDTVFTPDGGRCELQFDNGTVIRLDKGSRLRLATVLAPSLTSNWKITTLELEKGQLYALPQTYGREMFQVVTPTAAANLKSRVIATLRLDADGGTSFFSGGGKFQVLYGADGRSLKKATVKAGRPLAITAADAPAEPAAQRDIEFMAWNEFVDRHFKELHYGISRVPPKLKFGNSALTYWAEKWSSHFGEWIYDELFGYVWRPADEHFAFARRPFFFADFVRVNGDLFLVPQQPWAWVPAHMGTWVWLKRGWTWIPGDWFHNGIVDYDGSYTFPTLGYYWGMFSWNNRWKDNPGRLSLPPRDVRKTQLPDPALDIVKKVMKASDADGSLRQAIERDVPVIDGAKLPPLPGSPPESSSLNRGEAANSGPVLAPQAGKETPSRLGVGLVRDWNPDKRWAIRSGCSIRYSSSKNAVVCPELKISSDSLQGVERMMLRNASRRQTADPFSRGSRASQQGGSTGGSSNNGTDAPAQGNSGTGEKDDGKG